MNNPQSSQSARQHRYALYSAIIVIAVMAVGIAAFGWRALTTGESILFVCAGLFAGVLAAWVAAILLAQRNRHEQGVMLGLAALAILVPLNSLLIAGQGVGGALAIAIGGSMIAGLTLTPARARWFFVLMIGSGLAAVLLDLYGSPARLRPDFEPGANIVLVLAVLAIAVLVLLEFKNFSLRTKLVIAFVTVAVLAVAGVTWAASQAIQNNLTANSARDLRTRAQSAALAIGITTDRNVDRLETMSFDKRLQDDVSIISDAYPAARSERDELLARNTTRWASADPQDLIIRNALNGNLATSLRQFGEVFQGNKELLMTDQQGSVIAATDWQPTYNFSQEVWWQNAFAGGRGAVYISQPEFNPMINEYGIRTALPIYSASGNRVVGVLHSIYTLTALQRALLLNSFGETGKVDLLFPQGQILTSDGAFRALTNTEFEEVKAGINQPLAMLTYRGTPLLSAQGVVGVSDEQPEPYLRASAWRTIATIQEDEALGAVEESAQAALLAGLLAILFAILLALALAQFLTSPIRRLTAVADRVQGGDLAARASVETGDEIGTLAKSFNNMTARLQDTLGGLERRVVERTQELSQANLSLQSNSAYLSALSDTSSGLFERLDVNELLHAILERAGALLGTQHGFVFFGDPGEDEIEMRVGSGLYDDLVGTRAQRGVGLAGTVWQTGSAMVIDDYQKWEGRLPGSRRDALRAIVAVPLIQGGGKGVADNKPAGVIGVAYTEQGRTFGKNELEILQRFAQLASIALDNAELYASSESRVQELAALNTIGQIISQPSEERSFEERVGDEVFRIFDADFGYVAMHNRELNRIEFPYVVDEGQRVSIDPLPMGQGITAQVISTGQPLLLTHATEADYTRMGAVDSGDGISPGSLVAVPIQAGEQIIGVLSVQRVALERPYTPADQGLLATIAASVGVGFENARLAEATNRRVAELSAVNRIATVLNMSGSLDWRLKQVGREMVSTFRVSTIYIVLHDSAQDLITWPFFADEGVESEIAPSPRRSGFVSHILETRQPLVVNHHLLERFQELGAVWVGDRESDPQSYLGMPIAASDNVYGVVALTADEVGRFSEADVRFLGAIAGAMAAAIQNARLFEQTQAALANSERLAERERIAAEQVMALNRRLTREGWAEYATRHAGELVGKAELESAAAGANGQTRALAPAGNGSGNGNANEPPTPPGKIKVPIVLRGEVLGDVELEYDDLEHDWSEDRQELVNDVVENLGLALDNARLFTESQRRVTELDALNSISQAMTTELELESLLNTIGDQLRTIFDVENTYIALYNRETQMISLPYFVNDNQRVKVEPMVFGEGITSHIIRTREPLVINDHTEQVLESMGAKVLGNPARSYLGVPILVGEDVTGVISIQSIEREGMFDDSNVRLMETIAATVGAAIQNAQLYGAMQQEVVVRQRAEEEIKLSLREKEVLLKEIHHRVKNNLQIITSLLNLQSAQLKDPESLTLFRESQFRVRSMALIHEKLYQSKDLARIEFDSYVRDLMVYLFRSYAANPDQIRMRIETNDIYLGIDTAIPCGLIISELVTNTIKYAFPGGRRGELHVGLVPEANGYLTLVVEDNGIGLPQDFDWRESDSLGLQLVNTLSSQLHGDIQVSGEGGTSFRITFLEV